MSIRAYFLPIIDTATVRVVYLDDSQVLSCYLLSILFFFFQITPSSHFAIFYPVLLSYTYLLQSNTSSLLAAISHHALSFLAALNDKTPIIRAAGGTQLESAMTDHQGDNEPPRRELNTSHSTTNKAALALQVGGVRQA
jgi:hypothetical protein